MKFDAADGTLLAWMNERHQGSYADGSPYDEVAYLQCKLILKPARFTSAHVFKEFAHLVKRAAADLSLGFIAPAADGGTADLVNRQDTVMGTVRESVAAQSAALSQAADAHRMTEADPGMGKIVLDPTLG